MVKQTFKHFTDPENERKARNMRKSDVGNFLKSGNEKEKEEKYK